MPAEGTIESPDERAIRERLKELCSLEAYTVLSLKRIEHDVGTSGVREREVYRHALNDIKREISEIESAKKQT